MRLPAEDFFDTEADDVTVDRLVDRNADPLAFLILFVENRMPDWRFIRGGAGAPGIGDGCECQSTSLNFRSRTSAAARNPSPESRTYGEPSHGV